MEPTTIEKKETAKPKRELKDYGKSKNLDVDTAKVFHSLKEKANKKDFGRRITDADILSVAVRLITAEHIKKIQDDSLTERDRLNQAHNEYMKAHGKITLDQFIGKLLSGEFAVRK